MTTSQTDQGRPHDYRHHTCPAVEKHQHTAMTTDYNKTEELLQRQESRMDTIYRRQS